MKPVGLKVGILAISLAALSTVAAHAEGPPVRNCTWCHGTSGQGLTPAPRLAGQRPLYIESQLRQFGHHTRDIPRLSGLAYTYLKRRLEAWGEGYHAGAKYPMARVAKKLSPDQIEALASYLSFLE